MEAALGLATLAAVVVLCLAGVAAVSMQVRCVDAAREAARLAARGEVRAAAEVGDRIAPAGAAVQVRRDGEFAVAVVTVRPALLPALRISAEAVSAVEPSGRSG